MWRQEVSVPNFVLSTLEDGNVKIAMPEQPATSKSKLWIQVLKVLIGVVILAILASRIDRTAIDHLVNHPKRWDLLGVAMMWVLLAHLITYLRWWQMVVSLGVPLSLVIAIRVGFLGTLFNMVSVGAIGGDVFKAVIATRAARDKMPEIVASVLVDRIVGLIGLILVTSVSFETYARLASSPISFSQDMQYLRYFCFVAAISSIIGLVVLASLGKHFPAHWFRRLPLVGSMAVRMASVAHVLHGRPLLLAFQIALSCGVHIALTLGFYSVSRAFYDQAPGFLEHMITIPPAFAISALPITPGGVGVFEVAVVQMMKALHLSDATFDQLIVVVLAVYRLFLLATAAIGGVYYFFGFGRLAKAEEKIVADLSQS